MCAYSNEKQHQLNEEEGEESRINNTNEHLKSFTFISVPINNETIVLSSPNEMISIELMSERRHMKILIFYSQFSAGDLSF